MNCFPIGGALNPKIHHKKVLRSTGIFKPGQLKRLIEKGVTLDHVRSWDEAELERQVLSVTPTVGKKVIKDYKKRFTLWKETEQEALTRNLQNTHALKEIQAEMQNMNELQGTLSVASRIHEHRKKMGISTSMNKKQKGGIVNVVSHDSDQARLKDQERMKKVEKRSKKNNEGSG